MQTTAHKIYFNDSTTGDVKTVEFEHLWSTMRIEKKDGALLKSIDCYYHNCVINKNIHFKQKYDTIERLTCSNSMSLFIFYIYFQNVCFPASKRFKHKHDSFLINLIINSKVEAVGACLKTCLTVSNHHLNETLDIV